MPGFDVDFGPDVVVLSERVGAHRCSQPECEPGANFQPGECSSISARRRPIPRSKVVVVSVGIGKVISEDLQWRAASADDLETVDRIGNEIHVHLQERAEVFAEKFNLFDEGCFVLASAERARGWIWPFPSLGP